MGWRLVGATSALAVGALIARGRRRRPLHPAGRSFTGELEVWGLPAGGCGIDLVDTPARHPVTVRLSKGAGTPGGWPDVRGLAVRVPGQRPGQQVDLLLSTTGRGRWSRHLPVPRWHFDTWYGSVTSYRTGPGPGGKVYLAAVPDSPGTALGPDLRSVATAAATGARMLLVVADPVRGFQPFARLTFGRPLPAGVDAALAFDPIRNSLPGLHPAGLIHASRGIAYPLAQWWRGLRPAAVAGPGGLPEDGRVDRHTQPGPAMTVGGPGTGRLPVGRLSGS